MATATPPRGDDLDYKIQGLAQELQDMILNYHQDMQLPGTVLISESYKPPVALQLNQKLRAEFAAKYYVETIFESAAAYNNDENSMLDYAGVSKSVPKSFFHKWLFSLRKSHLSIVGTVKFTVKVNVGARVQQITREAYSHYLQTMWDHTIARRSHVCHITLQLSFEPRVEDGIVYFEAETFSVKGNIPDKGDYLDLVVSLSCGAVTLGDRC